MVVARWRPHLARIRRSSSRRWRSSTRRSAPCCRRMTLAWRSSTKPGCTAWGKRRPKSCCTPTITLWRRWQMASPWSGEQRLCYHWLATCTKCPNIKPSNSTSVLLSRLRVNWALWTQLYCVPTLFTTTSREEDQHTKRCYVLLHTSNCILGLDRNSSLCCASFYQQCELNEHKCNHS